MAACAIPICGLFALAACGTTEGTAERPPQDPSAVLERARIAAEQVRTASYRAHFALLVENRDAVLTRDGEVWFEKFPVPEEAPHEPLRSGGDGSAAQPAVESRLRVKVRIELADGTTTVFDGAQAFLLVPEAGKVVIAGLADGGEGFITGRLTGNLVETPLLQPDRLPDAAASLTGDGTAVVSGVQCAVIHARPPDNAMLSDRSDRLYLGRDDHLLRKREVEYLIGGRRQRETWVLTDLEVNAAVPADRFTIEAPADFEIERYEPPAPPELLGEGAEAPPWTLEDPAGEAHALADYHGKVVVLDFWGTWCGPCLMAMPALQKVHERFAHRGVVVIGVSCGEPPGADPAGLMKEKGYTYPLLLKGDEVAEAYQVSGYPTLYIVDRQGRIAGAHVGYSEEMERELTGSLESLLDPR